MSTFFHDGSLQMGLNKTNYYEKTVGHLNILDVIQVAEENITGLEKRLETAPLQAEGKASRPKTPWVWGMRGVQAHSSCSLLGTVMSKQVTTALSKAMVRCNEMVSPILGAEGPDKCYFYWSNFSREDKKFKSDRKNMHETRSLFLLKIGRVAHSLAPGSLWAIHNGSPLWS